MDDLFGDKKEETTVLDLSKCSAETKEEFKRILEQVPDYKTRPIKVRQEEIKIREKDFKFKISKKKLAQELRRQELQAAAPLGSPTAGASHRPKEHSSSQTRYKYQNPVPVEMQSLKLDELYAVPIDWRMLTTLRPKNRIDEEYFSRLVELGKASLRTLERDRTQEMRQPDIRKTKNKAGVIETRLISCAECLDELCDGKTCYKFTYDQFARPGDGEGLTNATAKPPAGQTASTGQSGTRAKTRAGRRPKTGANQRGMFGKGKLKRSKSVGDAGGKIKSGKSAARSKSLGRKHNG